MRSKIDIANFDCEVLRSAQDDTAFNFCFSNSRWVMSY
jgi:hypothetical protein